MTQSFIQNIGDRFRKQDLVMRIILLNIIVFSFLSLAKVFYQMGYGFDAQTPIDRYIIKHLVLPSSLSSYVMQPWSIVTYMFWHGGIWHIAMNMFMFYIFGSLFQEYLGNKRLISVYIWGGISGGFLFVLLYNIFPAFENVVGAATLMGASAAVMALLTATATLLPRYELNVFGIFPIRLPFIAIFYALLSMLSMAGSNAGGEMAHVGGAIFGFLYIKAIYSNFTWISNLKKKLKTQPKQKKYSPNMKVYEPSKTYIKPHAKRQPSQEEIDMILDKITASGYESLNQSEKEILFKASNKDA